MTTFLYTKGPGKGYAKCKSAGSFNPRKVASTAVGEYFTKDTILRHLSRLNDKEAIDAFVKIAQMDPSTADALRLELLREKHGAEMKLLLTEIDLKGSALRLVGNKDPGAVDEELLAAIRAAELAMDRAIGGKDDDE